MNIPGLKIIDYYIIKKFLGTFFFAIVLIMGIAIVFDFAEKLDEFLRLLKYLPELRGYFPEIDQEEAKALDDLFAERVQKAKKRLNEKKE